MSVRYTHNTVIMPVYLSASTLVHPEECGEMIAFNHPLAMLALQLVRRDILPHAAH